LTNSFSAAYYNKMRVVFVLIMAVVAVASANPAGPFAQQVADGKRLIQTSESEPPVWMTEAQVEKLIREDFIHFMDITDYPQAPKVNHPKAFTFPTQLFYQRVVSQITPLLSMTRMEAFIEEFSSYNNRYYNSETGRQSSVWLQSLVQDVVNSALANGYAGNVSVFPVTHSWPQNSVIARIEGSDSVQKSQILVLGAHQDSINSGSPANGNAPGADDDGSGCIVLLETLQVLLEAGFVPRRTIEFQWYAAEEIGLRGSQDIANDYNARGVDVVSMVQYDVVGYFVGRREIGILNDFVDPAATQFLRIIIDGYCSFTWVDQICGYGCSDHASWYRAGYPASVPAEVVLHPSMHTVRDTISTVNFEQVHEFCVLSVAHTVELALSVS